MNNFSKTLAIVFGALTGAAPYVGLSLLAENISTGLRYGAIAIPCILAVSVVLIVSRTGQKSLDAFLVATAASIVGTLGVFLALWATTFLVLIVFPKTTSVLEQPFDIYKLILPSASLIIAICLSRLVGVRRA